jgi:hypothetical protein
MAIVTLPRSKTAIDRIRAAIRKRSRELLKDRETARSFLIRTNSITPQGKLKKLTGK